MKFTDERMKFTWKDWTRTWKMGATWEAGTVEAVTGKVRHGRQVQGQDSIQGRHTPITEATDWHFRIKQTLIIISTLDAMYLDHIPLRRHRRYP